MMDENFEIKISLYFDCVIRKGHYHDFTNSYESDAINLEHVNIKINEVNLKEVRRKILNEMNSKRMEINSVLDCSSKKLAEGRTTLHPQKSSKSQRWSWKRRCDIQDRDHDEKIKYLENYGPLTGILHIS
jgi:hypothetical protein